MKNTKFTADELTPVVFGDRAWYGGLPVDFDVEVIGNFDTVEETTEEDEVEAEVFTRKVISQAKEIESRLPNKMAGNGTNGLTSIISKLLDSKVNWKRELNKHLNLYYSNNCSLKGTKKSIINYPWNPKSRYGILCKHHIETNIKKQAYIIIAVDTSGSCFFDKYEVESFFTEIEAISKEFNFSKRGEVITIQWDTQIVEGLKRYEKNDWKKYKLRGGGGTRPECVFRYLTDIYKKQNGWYIINENGVKFVIEDKKKLPLLIFLTDGYFYNKLGERSLGIYKNNMKNILFFTRKTDMIYPKENYILYEE